jgi:hypothetical protein
VNQPPYGNMPSLAPEGPPSLPTQPDTASALALLREVVQDFEETGRRPFTAAIKPEMKRRNPEFSEAKLGFVTFRDFVLEMARTKQITVEQEGSHLVLHVPGIIARRTIKPADSGERGPIRPDLWTAFVDWRDNKHRVWDTVERRALIFNREPAVDEPESETQDRKLVAEQSERFISIPYLTFEKQHSWMKEYAESVNDSTNRRLLMVLLGDERPAYAFHLFLRRSPELVQSWKTFKVERVRIAVKDWLVKNDLDEGVLRFRHHTPPAAAEGPGFTSTAPHDPRKSTERTEQVRAQVMAAVERMSLPDLLRLSIPVEYMVDAD